MIENVRGLLGKAFFDYSSRIRERLSEPGNESEWELLEAHGFGVPQWRPSSVLGARCSVQRYRRFGSSSSGQWRRDSNDDRQRSPLSVHGRDWLERVSGVERASFRQRSCSGQRIEAAWRRRPRSDLSGACRRKDLGVYALVLTDQAPQAGFEGDAKLTVEMAAVIQGFPADGELTGRKTTRYRQIGNAFPPPVAEAVGRRIAVAIEGASAMKHLSRKRSSDVAGRDTNSGRPGRLLRVRCSQRLGVPLTADTEVRSAKNGRSMLSLPTPNGCPPIEPWEVTLVALIRQMTDVPPIAAKALGLLDRFGSVSLSATAIGLDGSEIEWSRVTGLSLLPLSKVLSDTAIEREAERARKLLPPMPGRKWAVDKVTAVISDLATEALARVGREGLHRPVISQISGRGRLGKKELSVGAVAAAVFGLVPEATECACALAEQRGIPVAGGDSGRNG